MSYLLESLGRGLIGRSLDAFRNQLPPIDGDALSDLEARLAQCPESQDLRARLALCHLEERRYSAARVVLAQNRAERPSRVIQILSACLLEDVGDSAGAQRAFEQLRASDPRDPSAAFVLGVMHERAGARADAQREYADALTRCPGLRNARERLVAIALQQGQLGAALEQAQALAELDPGELGPELTVATLHLLNGDPACAVEAYQRALLIEPQCTEDAIPDLSDVGDEQSLDRAVSVVQRLTETYSGVAEFHVQLGDLRVKTGDDEAAVSSYEEALRLQPDYLEATVKLGAQHYRRGRYHEAARVFGRAVELNDRMVTTFVGLSVAQRSLGKTDESRATLELAIGLEPNSTLLFFESSRLQFNALRSAPESRPSGEVECAEDGDEGLTFARERSTARPDPLTDVLRRYRQGLINAPNDAGLRFGHGLLLRQLGEPLQALQEFRTAAQIDPDFGRAQMRIGLSELELGDADAAQHALRRALLPAGDAITRYYDLALLFSAGGKFDAAVEQFESQDWRAARQNAFRENLLLSLQHVGLVDRADAAWHTNGGLTRGVDWTLRGPLSAPLLHEE